MLSERPKVLHLLAGKPLLCHVLETAFEANVARAIVVVGYAANEVKNVVREHITDCDDRVAFVVQPEQRGTGHAVRCALDALDRSDDPIWILSGDVPLVRPQTLVSLADQLARGAVLALATFGPADPTGYGRVVRDQRGHVVAIREECDADVGERAISECNAGIYCVRAASLKEHVEDLRPNNAKHEIYLTDLVARVAVTVRVATVAIDPIEATGVNTPEQLLQLEALLTARTPS